MSELADAEEVVAADPVVGGELAPETPKAKAKRGKLPAWLDAIPDELDVTDDLEVIATLGFRSLAVALTRVCADRFMKIGARVALISQINAQLNVAKSMRRIWLAEQVIKGNDRAIAETARGRTLEARDHASGTDGTQQASRPATRRGRPRKR